MEEKYIIEINKEELIAIMGALDTEKDILDVLVSKKSEEEIAINCFVKRLKIVKNLCNKLYKIFKGAPND